MKTTKFFAVVASAGILTFSLASPSLAFAQSVAHPPKSHDARLQTKRLVLEESNERRVRKVVINKISFFIAVLLYFLYDYIRMFLKRKGFLWKMMCFLIIF